MYAEALGRTDLPPVGWPYVRIDVENPKTRIVWGHWTLVLLHSICEA